LEKDKLDWYKCQGLKPPQIDGGPRKVHQTKADVQTYTKTTILDVFAPPRSEFTKPFSYWEVPGAGIEPVEFNTSVSALRSPRDVISPVPYKTPKRGRLNNCFSPYQNDLMSFNAFDTIRKELKHRSDHLAAEMKRVQEEWVRPPQEKWFALRDRQFSVKHSRFMEVMRRSLLREKCPEVQDVNM
jgi:hypothetical protein